MTNDANSKRENENSNQETINGNNLWTGCRCEVGMWDFVPFHYKEKDCGGFFVDVVHSVFSRVYFLFRCWAPLGVCWLLFSCDPLCLPRNFGFCFCFLVGLFG